MKAAVHHGNPDLQTERQLVLSLESDDPAVRIYAISALEKLWGRRLGYNPYADEAEREAAVRRWRSWLAQREADLAAPGAASQPFRGTTWPNE